MRGVSKSFSLVGSTAVIRANTYGAAYGAAVEDKIGSIKVGKLADLIVLEKNLFDIDPHDIHKTKVLLTIMDGKVRHDAMNVTK